MGNQLVAVRKLLPKIEAALGDLDQWHHDCHSASLKVVKSGVLPGSRIARGSCIGVFGQHSWVVVGNPYDERAPIVDPTLWSYDDSVSGVWFGTMRDKRHRPHGHGSIWKYGRPPKPTGDIIELTPSEELSEAAKQFLWMTGPLDKTGWHALIHSPVGGWPAGEIIAAVADTPKLAALVPIDILGMVTDRNPGGLYLPGEPEPCDD